VKWVSNWYRAGWVSRRTYVKVRVERDKALTVLAAIHEAIGEDPNSDDESLPEVIAQMIKEFRARIAWHEAQEEILREELGPEFDAAIRRNRLRRNSLREI
jgi:hypothetical protein